MDPLTTGPGSLTELLEETRAIAEENNKILKRMERNATIGFFVKLVLWLVILGVPIFFLSSYLGPLMDALAGQNGAESAPSGLFGIPSAEELQGLLEQYEAQNQAQ